MKKNENSDDSDISFSSHIELGELGNSQLLSTQKLIGNSQNGEIAASVNNRHRILNQIFHGWRDAVAQMKIKRLNKMTFQRYFSKKKLFKFFNVWKDQYSLFQNLHNLGQNILITKHFQIWNRYIIQKFEDRKKFMRFLQKRRKIYEQKYFNEYKRSMHLKRCYYQVGKQSDQKLGFLVVSAFRILIKMKRQQENLEDLVKKIHEKHVMTSCLISWMKKLRLVHLSRLFQKNHLYQTKMIFFEKWIIRKRKHDKATRQFKAVQKNSRKFLMRFYFFKWNAKFISKVEVEDKFEALSKIVRRIAFEKYFMKWLSRFNTINYLSSSEKILRNLIKDIIIRRYFFMWHSKYDIIRLKYIGIKSCEEKMRIRRLSRAFMQFRSQYVIHNFEKVMSKKARRRIDNFLKNIYWGKWRISLKSHREDRLLNESATNFRCLSLKLKAFNRFKIYYKNKNVKHQQLLIAQAHYVYHLESSAMITWKLLHIKTKRRFLMVSSVLKVWAHNLQLKKFRQWMEYTSQKKKQRKDVLEAINIHKRRNVSMAITCFVLATKSLCVNNSDSELNLDSSEDLLKSTLSFDDSIVYNNKSNDNEFDFNNDSKDYPVKGEVDLSDFNHDEIYLGNNKLPPPKRPEFLGQKAEVFPMQHMISMVNEPFDYTKEQNQLKDQIEDVIAKIQRCNENEEEDNVEEVKKLNLQLKSLMDQANQFLSQLP